LAAKRSEYLNFNSLRENHIERCDFDIVQAIADLVAFAVATSG
jgi:hypothetical protein